MATFTWSDLINRARTYIDDDHDEEEGWLSPETWLALGNVEYAVLFPRLVRAGLIVPETVDQSFSGPTVAVAEVLAIVGVAENLGGGRYRLIEPLQSTYGRDPFRSAVATSPAIGWLATGAADDVTVSLQPESTGSYVVRYIAVPEAATALDDEVELPYGCDERLVLGMARRAKLKEMGASAILERLIMEKDADIAMQAHGRVDGDGPRARPRQIRASETNRWPWNPTMYRYM